MFDQTGACFASSIDHQTQMDDHSNHKISDKVLQMLAEGKTQAEAESALTAMGLPYTFVKEIVAETIKLRNAQRQSKGLYLIIAGAICCVLSFLLTITGICPDFGHGIVLYGLTGVGVMIVFFGFTFIF